jgi:UDP-3-O-[3-hydroxymyristoyl] glucosamine N-acyltransferase
MRQLKDIAKAVKAPITEAHEGVSVYGVKTLQNADGGSISFLSNSKYASDAERTGATAVLVSPKDAAFLPAHVIPLVVDNPYAAFAIALTMFHPAPKAVAGIHSSAVIHADAAVAPSAEIGPYVVIEEGVTVAENCIIDSHVVLKKGTSIGESTRIGSGSVLQKTTVGAHCLFHSGVKTGQDGFGFAPTGTGVIKVPQVGSVIIGNHVEIGANCTIDCGALEDTIIGDGCKLDNQVQIAHNVKIGMFCMIAGQAGIAGSTTLGNGIVVGGQSAIAGHLSIADGTTLAGRSGVTKSITNPGETWGGLPALPIREWRRMNATLMRMMKSRNKGK